MNRTELTDSESAAAVAFLFETGTLRALPRTGWRYDLIPDPETVAEHSHRTAVIGPVLAVLEGADPARTTLLCTYHDVPETRLGDQTPITRRYVSTADPRKVIADQVFGTHPALQAMVAAAVEEFEAGESPEAVCARDADKLDCLLRALEYQAVGYPSGDKAERCRAALVTDSARRLADAAIAMDPAQWQHTLLGTPAAN
ncbi:HD family hydrolase [Kitasatospora sp. NPDC088783]|uniref:HD domain-containing protein n=1 Tax=Kitasatospora sp. NPDC088783 TaxID=3364077 RepID=UPI0038246EE5